MVVHNSTYFLFPSKSGGYWHTKDLSNWEFVTPTGLPLEDYAPMVVVIGESWYYTAFNSKQIFTTSDPYVMQSAVSTSAQCQRFLFAHCSLLEKFLY